MPPLVQAPPTQPERPGVVLKDLSDQEMEARRRALAGAKEREVEDRARAAEDAARRAEEEERRRLEREESARRQAEEEARIAAEAEARSKAEEEALRRAPEVVAPPVEEEVQTKGRSPGGKRPVKQEAPRPTVRPKGEDERRRGKLTLARATSDDGDRRGRSLSSMRRRQEKFKRAQNQEPREKISREVTVPETITIQELAQRMTERSVDVIKFLMKEGQMMKPGDVIDSDLAQIIAEEFGHTVKRVAESDVEEGLFDIKDNPEDMKPRPPGCHHYGSCRSRQDVAAGCNPHDKRRFRRSGWHHPAYRCLIRLKRTARKFPSSIRPAMLRLPQCVHAVPR